MLLRRWWLRAALLVVAACCNTGAGLQHARADDGADDASADDLLAYRPLPVTRGKVGINGWTEWWYANRASILEPSYRVAASDGGPLARDENARERARTVLLGELASKRELVRSEAALALGRHGDARNTAALAAIVEDTEIAKTRRTHRWAAIALGMLEKGDAQQDAVARSALVGALQRARGDRDHFVFFWANCAYAIAMRGDAAALPDLVRLRVQGLSGKTATTTLHTDVLGAMTYPIAVLGGELLLPEIAEHLGGARSPDGGSKDSAWAACHALSRVPSAELLRLLREATGDERRIVRRVATSALGGVAGPDDDDTAALLRALIASEEDHETRQMAILSLARTGHATARPVLEAHWKDSLEADHAYLALGLGLLARRTGDASLGAYLLEKLLAEQDQEQKAALSLACGLASVDAARPTLADHASRSSAFVAAQSSFALGETGAGPAEREALYVAMERSGEFMVQREAALALGRLSDPDVVARLRETAAARKRPDLERATALICLGRVGSDADIDSCLELLDDARLSTQLRACVINCLGLLLDRSEGAALRAVTADSLCFFTWRGKMLEPIQDLQMLSD